MRGPGYGFLLAGQILERTGEWLYTIALVVAVYRLTESVAVVAALSLAQVLPRLILLSLDRLLDNRAGKRLLLVAGLFRIPLVGSLLLISTRPDLIWAAGSLAAIGALGAVADATRAASLPTLVPRRRLGIVNALNGRAEQVSFVLGAVITGLTIAIWDERAAFGVAAALLAASLLLLTRVRTHLTIASTPALPNPVRESWAGVRRHPVLRLLATGLFAGAVLGISLRVTLVEVTVRHVEPSGAVYALLLSAVGLGLLVGPISIPRVLGRARVESVVTGIVVVLAFSLAIVGSTSTVALIALVLFITGVLAITNDLITTTMTRRLVSESQLDGMFRLMMGGVISGQFVALVAILGLTQVWSLADVTLAIASGCALIAAVLFFSAARLKVW